MICFLPFLLILSGSFSDNAVILTKGYNLIPQKFSTQAYSTLFKCPKDILNAYRVTTLNTLIGTLLGLFCISMAGYVLSRKDFKYRNVVSFLIYFTSIFGGGLVPWYMMYVSILNWHDSYLALCFPLLMNPFLIILMRTFISSSLPDALVESAKIDGAGQFGIYLKIVLPVITPALATVGLFLALGYWNDWYLSSLFITTPAKYELQYYLYNMVTGVQTLSTVLAGKTDINLNNLPTETVKLAMAVLATGPVFLFYPFVQKYFVEGITVGSVKG